MFFKQHPKPQGIHIYTLCTSAVLTEVFCLNKPLVKFFKFEFMPEQQQQST